jgi:hypothetical protein
MLRSRFHCPDCGGSDAYRSRRRTFLERFVLPFFLLRPVRCSKCFLRINVSALTRARPREHRPSIKPQAAA